MAPSPSYATDEPESLPQSSNPTCVDEEQKMISYNSDVEGAERPVREKLKKTSIASLAQFNSIKSGQVQALTSNLQVGDRERQSDTELMGAVRGRPARKRSFDDLQKDDLHTPGDSGLSEELDKNVGHKRMRSRDVSGGDDAPSDGEPEPEAVDQEESDVDARRSPGGPGVLVEAPARTETTPSRSAPEAEESVLSPKKKRSRDQFDKDEEHEDLASEDSRDGRGRPASDLADGGEPLAQTSSRTAKGEPEKKRPRDEEQNSITDEKLRAKGVQTTSSFANTASISPLGVVASPKSPEGRLTEPALSPSPEPTKQDVATSTDAFAKSGLFAFSNSERSPFGALGASSGKSPTGFGSLASTASGGFGSGGSFDSSPFATKSASSRFDGLSGSGFRSTLGGAPGFGASRPLGGGLSSFAGPVGSNPFSGGVSSAKAFGAPEDEEENDSEADESNSDEDASGEDGNGRAKDKRFIEQDLETGEEGEDTVFACRAKLYHFEPDTKEWKERGVGQFKINIAWAPPTEDSEHSTPKSRLIMRTDGVHRVVLNTPIFKGMKVGTSDGSVPTGKTINITGSEGDKMGLFLLKIGKEDVVKDLYWKIVELEKAI